MSDRFMPNFTWEMRERAIAITGADFDTDDLLAWCDDRDYIADVGVERGHCTATIRIRRGKQRRHLAWGEALTPRGALAMAIVRAFAPDEVCRDCFGFGIRMRDNAPCPTCHATGLISPGDETA